VPFQLLTVVQGDTALTVDQGATNGSVSIATAGAQIRKVAAEARGALLALAADRLGVPVDQLRVQDGVVSSMSDPARQVSYGQLVAAGGFALQLTGDATTKNPADYTIVGQPFGRVDIPAKMAGTFEYVQNVRVPGMLHARVVRPAPESGASVLSVDQGSISDVPGIVQIVTRDNWVGIVAQREEQAIRAAQQLQVTWSDPVPLPSYDQLFSVVRAIPGDDQTLSESGNVDAALSGAATLLSATYEFPPQAHGMIGPSCAVADVRSDGATVWSGTQYPVGLAREVATRLNMPSDSVHVIYVEGSGCYGRYSTDDAAIDAAYLSQTVGQPVRVQWMRADEHGWDHFSPAMLFDIRGGLDGNGNVIGWDYEVWSASHVAQPYLGDQTGGPWTSPRFVGDDTQTSYGFPNLRLVLHAQPTSVLRHGNLRSLGAMMSTFASESFIDELAAAAGADPVQFRLGYLTDPRAIDVLIAAAQQSGWDARPSPGSSAGGSGELTGRGVSVAKLGGGPNGTTWIATIAEVAVDAATGKVRATRMTVAHDCGLIINPDGLGNQIEGNVIQSTSRALLEEVKFDESGVLIKDWRDYPIITFPDVPEVDIVLLDHPDAPASGAGESATIPTVAAIGNAIFDATGVRLRRAPFSADRVKVALSTT